MATAAHGALATLSGRDGRRRAVSTPPHGVDLGALKRELERDVRGEVRFDAGARALYANDFSFGRSLTSEADPRPPYPARDARRDGRPEPRGAPVVGLEPSCVAVFRDELVEMLPDDENAPRLRSQTFTLSEFLTEVDGFRPRRLERRALVQAHCHHRAVMGLDADHSVLASTGIETDRVEVACCGSAGSFGYGREKYAILMRIGERGILPAVREAPAETLVLADGFSCRSQIAHATGRRALHLAEALRMGMDGGEPL